MSTDTIRQRGVEAGALCAFIANEHIGPCWGPVEADARPIQALDDGDDWTVYACRGHAGIYDGGPYHPEPTPAEKAARAEVQRVLESAEAVQGIRELVLEEPPEMPPEMQQFMAETLGSRVHLHLEPDAAVLLHGLLGQFQASGDVLDHIAEVRRQIRAAVPADRLKAATDGSPAPA